MKNEKTLYQILLLIATLLLFTNCDPNLNYEYDNTPPSAPENVNLRR